MKQKIYSFIKDILPVIISLVTLLISVNTFNMSKTIYEKDNQENLNVQCMPDYNNIVFDCIYLDETNKSRRTYVALVPYDFYFTNDTSLPAVINDFSLNEFYSDTQKNIHNLNTSDISKYISKNSFKSLKINPKNSECLRIVIPLKLSDKSIELYQPKQQITQGDINTCGYLRCNMHFISGKEKDYVTYLGLPMIKEKK